MKSAALWILFLSVTGVVVACCGTFLMCSPPLHFSGFVAAFVMVRVLFWAIINYRDPEVTVAAVLQFWKIAAVVLQ